MFEEVFVSDSMILNIFIFIYMYWFIMVGVFAPAFYYVFLKIFVFPLITRKSHELVLIIKPESVTIKKITSRLTPFFYYKRNAYWFDEPLSDVSSLNKYNIYVEGINQNITHKEKHENKVHDILKELTIPKQITSHTVLLPKNIKQHFNRNFILLVDPTGQFAELSAVKERQPLKVNFYHTLGVYLQKQVQSEKPIEGETASGSGLKVVQLNTQVVLQEIKFASQYRYYSSYFAYSLSKRIQRTEKNWMTWIKGALDPKLIMAMIILMATVGVVILIMTTFKNPQALLGPMPTG
jgi:hypothetical protein